MTVLLTTVKMFVCPTSLITWPVIHQDKSQRSCNVPIYQISVWKNPLLSWWYDGLPNEPTVLRVVDRTTSHSEVIRPSQAMPKFVLYFTYIVLSRNQSASKATGVKNWGQTLRVLTHYKIKGKVNEMSESVFRARRKRCYNFDRRQYTAWVKKAVKQRILCWILCRAA